MRLWLCISAIASVVVFQQPSSPPTDRAAANAPDPFSLASSPNGEWKLRGMPQIGQHQVTYTLELWARGEAAAHWSRSAEFVVKAAVVTNAGMVGVYGYTTGEEPPHGRPGDFMVEIVDSENVKLHKTSITRSSVRVADSGLCVPHAEGQLRCECGDWLQAWILRMRDVDLLTGFSGEAWWIYDLKRGEFGGVMPINSPAAEDAGIFVPASDAFVVADTPLVAVLFRRGDDSYFTERGGNRLVLFDLRGHVQPMLVWQPSADVVAGPNDEAPIVMSAQHVDTTEAGLMRLRTNTGETLSWRVARAENGTWRAVRE